ncbi:YcxB family protein [Virgibacillus sp. W0181]|uniref:YcxB family protein n=1 Tax=Virgibacillus sp. W0181 TaxID=3391581 RepID=UPI003F47E4A8
MTIQFQLSMSDLIAFQRNVITHSRTHRIKQRYYKWISSVILLLAAFLLLGTSIPTMIEVIIITVIYFFLFPSIYNAVAMAYYKKQFDKKDYSYILAPCEMSLSNNGIERMIHEETTHYSWDRFENMQEDELHYFLYVSDLQGLILPKKSDSMSDADSIALSQLLKNHVEFLDNKAD